MNGSRDDDSHVTYSPEKISRMLADVIRLHNPVTDADLCVRAGVDVNAKVSKGLRPLHYAAYENYVEIIHYLVDQGADVNLSDDAGYTPLHIAAKHGQEAALRCLIAHGAVINFCDADTDVKRTNASQILSDLTINPLSLAIENDHHKCVEVLLTSGANPNQKYFLGHEITLIPLQNLRSLDVMLTHGANPDVFNRAGLSLLMRASKHGATDAVRVLLKHRANVNLQCPPKFDQKTALHFASMTGQTEICKLLLEAGSQANQSPDFQYGPIDYAITQDHYDVCKLLLDYGADANELNRDNCSPLQVACTAFGLKRRKDIVEVLLQNGAEPNYNSGMYSYIGPSLSPIVEYFTYNEDYDYSLVKTLVQHGSRVNMRLPTRLLKIKDPSGLLGQVHKLRPYEDTLRFLLDAAGDFDLVQIEKESSLSNRQKELLLEKATEPRSLMHLSRAVIRIVLHLPIYSQINLLPLPKFLKDYLFFNV